MEKKLIKIKGMKVKGLIIIMSDLVPMELENTTEEEKIDQATPLPQVLSEEIKVDDFINSSTQEAKQFAIKAKKFFLTYPRTQMTTDAVLAYLTSMLEKKGKAIDKYMIVQEFHKDGTPHIHALLEFATALKITNSNYFDLPEEPKHGNYGSVKNYPAAINYLKKAGIPIANWDYKTYTKAQMKKGHIHTDYTEVNQLALKEGIRALVDQGKIPLHLYGAWKRGLELYNSDLSRPPSVSEMTINLPVKFEPEEQFIQETIDLSSENYRHLWFFGGTGTGKTYCATHQTYQTYVIPKNNDWVGYNGQQLLILNEFKGEMTPTQLIDIMESAQQNIKGSSAILPKNVLLIVTSNYSLRECYHNLNEKQDEQLNALERRFHEVQFINKHPKCPQGRKLTVLGLHLSQAITTGDALIRSKRPRDDIEMTSENIKKFKEREGLIDS